MSEHTENHCSISTVLPGKQHGNTNRKYCFEHIKAKGRNTCSLTICPQHICHAGISAPMCPNIVMIFEPDKQNSAVDAAKQIRDDTPGKNTQQIQRGICTIGRIRGIQPHITYLSEPFHHCAVPPFRFTICVSLSPCCRITRRIGTPRKPKTARS